MNSAMKYLGVILMLLGVLCLVIYKFAAPENWLLICSMVLELGVAEQIEEPEPTISVDGNIVSVGGESGMKMEVVSLTGKSLMTVRIESPSQRIELNVPKGCYILKVGKVVRKVTTR